MPKFPILELSDWKPTRDTIHGYSKILGKIRSELTPKQKHWWNISLKCSSAGLITTPIPSPDNSKTFEIELDLTDHQVSVRTSKAELTTIELKGESITKLADYILTSLSFFNVSTDINKTSFSDLEITEYKKSKVEDFWYSLSQIDQIFKEFKGNLREETSPVQLWSHHFDLAFSWFSGRLVLDQDPNDEEYSDEQMGFGFSTGDEGIPNPYFYATAYPLPDGLDKVELPKGAKWTTEGFTGGLLMYEELTKTNDPKSLLMDFLSSMQNEGAKLMK